MNKLESTEKYLFLGLPGSGKTTSIALLLKELQVVGNLSNDYQILFCSEMEKDKKGFPYFKHETSDYVEDIISLLDQQKWPEPTERFQSCKIKYTYKDKKLESEEINRDIELIDCPGKAFASAFCSGYAIDDIMLEQAYKLKELIPLAKKIILFVDANAFFNETDLRNLRQSFEGLFEYLRYLHGDYILSKVSIVIDKYELLDRKAPDFLPLFRTRFSNAYQLISRGKKEFDNIKTYPILSLGSIDHDDDGAVLPPQKREKVLLDNLGMALGFDHFIGTWFLRMTEEEEKARNGNENVHSEGPFKRIMGLCKISTSLT